MHAVCAQAMEAVHAVCAMCAVHAVCVQVMGADHLSYCTSRTDRLRFLYQEIDVVRRRVHKTMIGGINGTVHRRS